MASTSPLGVKGASDWHIFPRRQI